MKLQLVYEIVWLCTEIANGTFNSIEAMNIVNYNEFSKPGQADF